MIDRKGIEANLKKMKVEFSMTHMSQVFEHLNIDEKFPSNCFVQLNKSSYRTLSPWIDSFFKHKSINPLEYLNPHYFFNNEKTANHLMQQLIWVVNYANENKNLDFLTISYNDNTFKNEDHNG